MKIRMSSVFSGWFAVLAMGMALALVPMAAQAAGMKPLSGGVGVEGRAPHPDYPLKLVFATTKGAYLANVNVKVYDKAGKEVTSAHSPGPWLFLDVPSGEYTVKAMTHSGKAASAMVNVTSGKQTVVNLTWKDVS